MFGVVNERIRTEYYGIRTFGRYLALCFLPTPPVQPACPSPVLPELWLRRVGRNLTEARVATSVASHRPSSSTRSLLSAHVDKMVRLQSGYAVAAASLALLSAAAAEQTPLMAVPGRNPLTDEFGDFVRQRLDRWKVPGMSLAVVDGHDIYAQVRTHRGIYRGGKGGLVFVCC